MESILFSIDDRPMLAELIIQSCDSAILNKNLGKTVKQSFSDGEQNIYFDETVRGKRVYLFSSPHSDMQIIRLTLAIDAAMRGGAKEIIPILPYFPYARQDKKDQSRGPIGGKVIAKILESAGATGVITFDLHADQIQGFFDIPVTHLEGKNVFYDYLVSLDLDNYVLCGPDAGSGKRVKRYKTQLAEFKGVNLPIVMMDKTRKKANEVEEMVIIGDVKGKDVIIIDDMVDTAGTLCKAADVLLENGAKSVMAVISHPVLSGKAYHNIANSNLTKLVVSDSLPLTVNNPIDKIEVVSVATQIAAAIHAIDYSQSFEEIRNKKSY